MKKFADGNTLPWNIESLEEASWHLRDDQKEIHKGMCLEYFIPYQKDRMQFYSALGLEVTYTITI